MRESGPALLRLGNLLTLDRGAAEDLAQETYIRVGLAWSRVRRDGNPVGYARRTMVNLFLNSKRRTQPTPVPQVLETPRDDAGLAAVDSAAVIRQILAGLPAQQRAALALRYLDDLPDAEIGALLGCTPATVRSHLSRGLATLRTRMKGEHDARRP
ncbi:sigma-70 family RNA polymerase sigma factor [Actinoplanes bogorensis]|uniref:Sigma-70 family RNA polymerase sigma factor n=1 Tax=Paractinoplanes bogorensis TaxID=1610840 RepID=A0ABS5YQX6_9ACTN|nr:sigma-70 family RNA polymerase sigma factor [Actinoplanes bogorensis]MBU2665863.1 sigma-70 family RNA polymerase sigma factor [Actinoplanes bogorensis]